MDPASNNIVYDTFWGHLDGFRKAILRAIGVILISILISFLYYPTLINFLTAPSNDQTLIQERIEYFRITNASSTAQIFNDPAQKNPSTIRIEPGESYEYSKIVPSTNHLLILGPLEGMLTALKVSLWMGTIASSPIWLLILLQYIAPALKDNERRLIFPFLITSILFVLLGIGLAYYVTIPMANTYLSDFNEVIGVNMWSLSHYLDYTLFLMLANGFAFELFAVGIFAVNLGVVTAEQLISARRYAIVLAFILGALLTPPDALTQIMLAIPLILLYECTILYSRFYLRPAREMSPKS